MKIIIQIEDDGDGVKITTCGDTVVMADEKPTLAQLIALQIFMLMEKHGIEGRHK